MKAPQDYAKDIKDALQRIEDEKQNIESIEYDLCKSLPIKKGDIIEHKHARHGKYYVHGIRVWNHGGELIFWVTTSDILKNGKVGKRKHPFVWLDELPNINLKDV